MFHTHPTHLPPTCHSSHTFVIFSKFSAVIKFLVLSTRKRRSHSTIATIKLYCICIQSKMLFRSHWGFLILERRLHTDSDSFRLLQTKITGINGFPAGEKNQVFVSKESVYNIVTIILIADIFSSGGYSFSKLMNWCQQFSVAVLYQSFIIREE